MEKELKEIDNNELLSIYRLLLEHEEYLENILSKLGEDNNEE